MSPSEKLDAALKELLEIIVRERLRVEFTNPVEDPQEQYGSFTVTDRKIMVFKERTEPLTAFHIYAFAHELKHYLQWAQLDGYDSWLYQIGAVSRDDQRENARSEIEADEYAVIFLKKHRIAIPKKLAKFISDRKTYYTPKL